MAGPVYDNLRDWIAWCRGLALDRAEVGPAVGAYHIELVHMGDDGGRRVVGRYTLEDIVGQRMDRPESVRWHSVSDYQHMDECPICHATTPSRVRSDHWRWHNEHGDA